MLFLTSCVSKETFEQQVATTASANRVIEDLRGQNAELLEEIVRVKGELEQRSGEAERCANDLNVANADLQRYGNEQQRLEGALGDARQDAVASFRSCQQRIEQLQAEVSALNKQAESERIACQARLANINNTCAQLTGALEVAQTDATSRADSLQQNLDACSGYRAELEQDGASCRQQLAEVTALREELSVRLGELEAQLGVLQKERQRAEDAAAGRRSALERMATRLREGLQLDIDGGHLNVLTEDGRVTVSIAAESLFAAMEANLTLAGKAMLGRIGDLLQGAKGLEINIEGHGGSGPVSAELSKGTPSRWELSTARAVQVMTALRLQSSMSKERLAVVDHGPAPVLADPGSDAGRGGEGQIDIVLLPERD